MKHSILKKLAIIASAIVMLTLSSCGKVLEELTTKPLFYVPPTMYVGQEFDIAKLSTLEDVEWETDSKFVTLKPGEEKTIVISSDATPGTKVKITAYEKGNRENFAENEFTIEDWKVVAVVDNKIVEVIESGQEVTFKIVDTKNNDIKIQKAGKIQKEEDNYHKITWNYISYAKVKEDGQSITLKPSYRIGKGAINNYKVTAELCSNTTRTYTPIYKLQKIK